MSEIQDLRSITPRTNATRSEALIKNVARHHSATDTGSWFTFWPFWNKERGWGTGGYHEIILRDGTVQLCYDPNEITNGVANHNTAVYNICLVGNGSFTAAQEKAWQERCLIALKRFNLPVSAVKGHNEFSGTNTSCPGINMNKVRSQLVKQEDVEQVSKPVAPKPVKPAPKPAAAKTESIVDYLNARGQASSFSARAKLATQYGISGYKGTAQQNTLLLERMRSGWKAPKPTKEYVQLPKSAATWRTYKLNVQPITENSDWSLTPAAFGGLEYEIIGRPQANVVTIKTSRGNRNIYVAPSTGAKIIRK